MKGELWLKIILDAPPAGVTFGIQRGRGGADPRAVSDGSELSLLFPVRFRAGKQPDTLDFAGEYVQGRPGERFIYVGVGTYAGEAGSAWERRAKVPLGDITPELAARALDTPSTALEARIPGRARDGGPVCASVRLLEPWRIVGRG